MRKNRSLVFAGSVLAVILFVLACGCATIFMLTQAHDKAVQVALKEITYTEETADADIALLEPYMSEKLLSVNVRGNLYKAMAELSYMNGDNTLYNHYMGYALYYLEQAKDIDSIVYLTNKYIGILYANGCYSAAEQVLQRLAQNYDISTFSLDTQSSYYLSCADVAQMLEKDDAGALEHAQAAISLMSDTGAKKLQQAKLDLLTARDFFQSGAYAQAKSIMASYNEYEDFGVGNDQVYVVCDYRIPYYEIMAKILLNDAHYDDAYIYADRYIAACNAYNFRVMKLRMLQFVVDATENQNTQKAEMYRNMEEVALRESMIDMTNAYGQYLLSDMDQTTQRIKAREEASQQLLWESAFVIGFLYLLLLVYCGISYVINTISKDGLTGLNNRKKYDKQVRTCFHKKIPYGLVVFDIDDFKKVNDHFGHQAGDDVLRTVGNILLSYEGRGISSYRYGGEELCVIMLNVPESRVREISEEIKHRVAQETGEGLAQVTVSGGISFSSQGEDAFAKADQNLYLAKAQGKNRVV